MKTFYGETLIHQDELLQFGIYNEIKIEYYKISQINENKKYGIEVVKKEYGVNGIKEETETVINITEKEENVNMILNKLKKNRVTPIILQDVIEDFKFQINTNKNREE